MIYFIQDSSTFLIKVGYTGGLVADRMSALQTGCPSGLNLICSMEGDQAKEKELHQRFASARERGEWFRPTPELLLFLIEDAGVKGFDQGVKEREPPAEKPASVNVWGKWPLFIYLAGKVGPKCWRREIVGDSLARWDRSPNDCPWQMSDEDGNAGIAPMDDWPILMGAIFGQHAYTGPFFIDCLAGNHCKGQCWYGDDNHGIGATEKTTEGHGLTVARMIPHLCAGAIGASDVLFACVDSPDCYGTIAEIGYAKALGKLVWIGGPRMFRDMWFIYEMADRSHFESSVSPRELLESCLEEHESRVRSMAL